MAQWQDRPNRIPWPPIVLVGGIAIAVALGIWAPAPWPEGMASDILNGVGVIFAAVAIALYVLSGREMSRRETAIMPTKAANHLVTTGPFAFTRNPIYLANVVLLLGLGMAFSNLWMMAMGFVVGFAERKLAIEREEAHLEHRFGKAFRDYKRKVRRWL